MPEEFHLGSRAHEMSEIKYLILFKNQSMKDIFLFWLFIIFIYIKKITACDARSPRNPGLRRVNGEKPVALTGLQVRAPQTNMPIFERDSEHQLNNCTSQISSVQIGMFTGMSKFRSLRND